MSPHAFDAAIALAAQGEGLWQGHTSPAYANMIGPFGGVTAAQALNAVLQHPQRLGEPVVFTVNFATALADGPFLVAGPSGRGPTARRSTGSSKSAKAMRRCYRNRRDGSAARHLGRLRGAHAGSASCAGRAGSGVGPRRMDTPL
jgi:hypothetical protein